MPRATTRDDLLAASEAGYAALMALLERLPPGAIDATFPFPDRDRCVRDVLGHLHAWHLMMLRWHDEGMAGGRPAIPAPGHTWRTLPALNQEIWVRCQDVDLATTRAALDTSHESVQNLIRRYSDEELFTKRRYPWTGTTSLGAYLVSATASHYAWALKKLRLAERSIGRTPGAGTTPGSPAARRP